MSMTQPLPVYTKPTTPSLLPTIPLPNTLSHDKPPQNEISLAAEATSPIRRPLSHTLLSPYKNAAINTSISMVKAKQFQCPYCPMIFTRAHNLKSHEYTHTKEKPWKCPHCPMAFSRQYDLKRHERQHSNDRPYECSTCKRTFSRIDALTRHKSIYNGSSSSCNDPVVLATWNKERKPKSQRKKKTIRKSQSHPYVSQVSISSTTDTLTPCLADKEASSTSSRSSSPSPTMSDTGHHVNIRESLVSLDSINILPDNALFLDPAILSHHESMLQLGHVSIPYSLHDTNTTAYTQTLSLPSDILDMGFIDTSLVVDSTPSHLSQESTPFLFDFDSLFGHTDIPLTSLPLEHHVSTESMNSMEHVSPEPIATSSTLSSLMGIEAILKRNEFLEERMKVLEEELQKHTHHKELDLYLTDV